MKEVIFTGSSLFEFRRTVLAWLESNLSQEDYIYAWPLRKVTFCNDEDAAAAILALNGRVRKTKIEEMIENESQD